MKQCLKMPLNAMVDYVIRMNRQHQRKSNASSRVIPGGLAVAWLCDTFELSTHDAVFVLRLAIEVGLLGKEEALSNDNFIKGSLYPTRVCNP
jgi:hypothetical protein